MKNCKERERPENKLNHRKPPNQTTDNQNNNNPATDKARKAQMGRAGRVQQETWGPLVQTSCDSPCKILSLAWCSRSSAHISAFSPASQLTHSLSPSHTGRLWVLPNRDHAWSLTLLRIFAIVFPGACKVLPHPPAACEKPLQQHRHSSNVTSFHKAVPHSTQAPRAFC